MHHIFDAPVATLPTSIPIEPVSEPTNEPGIFHLGMPEAF